MARRSRAQQKERAKNLKMAKWRYLLRHPIFRHDLTVLRESSTARGLSIEEIQEVCPYPADVVSLSLAHPTRETIAQYECSYTDKHDFADPELFWTYIRESTPPPRLNLGERLRLDKTEMYCTIFDLAGCGMSIKTIAVRLRMPVATVKSDLARVEEIIGQQASAEVPFGIHRESCSSCRLCYAYLCQKGRLLWWGEHNEELKQWKREEQIEERRYILGESIASAIATAKRTGHRVAVGWEGYDVHDGNEADDSWD